MSAERAVWFFDTNVLVYAHDTSAGTKQARAVDLLEQAAGGGTGALSVQVLQEFFVTVTRRIPRCLSARQAAAIVADLSTMVTYVPTATDVLGAIDIHRRLTLSFWDAMIIRSASELGATLLWSEDLSSGLRYEGVEVRNPFR